MLAGGFCKERDGIGAGPAGEGGRADRAHALNFKRAGHDDAEAEELVVVGAERGLEAGDLLGDEAGNDVRPGVGKGNDGLAANAAREVEEGGDHVVGGDFDAGGQRAIGIDGELDRRLAATGAQAPKLDEQALFKQFLDNIGNGLWGELGPPGNLRTPQMLVHTDDFEDDAAIMRAVPLGVRPDSHALAQFRFRASAQYPSPPHDTGTTVCRDRWSR